MKQQEKPVDHELGLVLVPKHCKNQKVKDMSVQVEDLVGRCAPRGQSGRRGSERPGQVTQETPCSALMAQTGQFWRRP